MFSSSLMFLTCPGSCPLLWHLGKAVSFELLFSCSCFILVPPSFSIWELTIPAFSFLATKCSMYENSGSCFIAFVSMDVNASSSSKILGRNDAYYAGCYYYTRMQGMFWKKKYSWIDSAIKILRFTNQRRWGILFPSSQHVLIRAPGVGNLIQHRDCKSSLFHLRQVVTTGFIGPGTLRFFSLAFFQDILNVPACLPSSVWVSFRIDVCQEAWVQKVVLLLALKIGLLWSHHWRRFTLNAQFCGRSSLAHWAVHPKRSLSSFSAPRVWQQEHRKGAPVTMKELLPWLGCYSKSQAQKEEPPLSFSIKGSSSFSSLLCEYGLHFTAFVTGLKWNMSCQNEIWRGFDQEKEIFQI